MRRVSTEKNIMYTVSVLVLFYSHLLPAEWVGLVGFIAVMTNLHAFWSEDR